MKLTMALLLFMRAWAEPILFRAPDASEIEYRARVRAEESLRTPTQAYLAQHPTPRSRESLLARFTRAQQAFLANSIGEARRHFQEVVALLPADDWAPADREIFTNALLRLAQLENGVADRDHWLAQIRFLGPGVKIQSELYPPPVLERLREVQRRQSSLEINLARLDWPLVLINGVACRPHACPSFPASESSVRLTFVSDQWVTQTLQADLGEIARLRPAKTNWVTGSCGRGELAPAARELGPGQAFFGLKCEEGAKNAGGPARAAELNPPFEAGEGRADGDPATLPIAAVTAVPAPRRPFYKSPWLWAGLGAVALTAITIAVKSSGHKSSPAPSTDAPPVPPTTVYGF